MKTRNVLAAVTAALIGVAAAYAYADHAQVTVSITPAAEDACSPSYPCITPSAVTLDLGGEVIWSNAGDETISINGSGNAIGDVSLNAGQTYSLQFDAAGEYQFTVGTHPWITGVITVVGGDDHSDYGDHAHDAVVSAVPLGLSLDTTVDAEGGIALVVEADGWRWTPENANEAPADGEGHAHVYVDGVQIGRAYGPHYYVNPMDPGTYQIRVALNDNEHNELTSDGVLLEALEAVLIPERDDDAEYMEPDPVDGAPGMAVSAAVHPDPLDGFNLQLNVTDFELTGAGVGGDHVSGEGYAKVFVDGEYLARAYELWHKLPGMDPGTYAITVALFANDHAPYHLDGEPVSATIAVEVSESADDHSDGDDSHGHGSHGH